VLTLPRVQDAVVWVGAHQLLLSAVAAAVARAAAELRPATKHQLLVSRRELPCSLDELAADDVDQTEHRM
jgi:hypothetical protein